ncbi:hypothetical protein SUGI_1106710 [Cryptomeria japonica]|uniref:U-box domain-containing protein 26 n=1 Tax=Cryptomeria japonica TaxID=3369 RepID=UPI002414C03C|nr:U-box domain-containing protein 26 [Cryptomeria japonica]GLJ52040.1 hypothetical protein SUGI_1106710 [Cryptomeria japonica]
MSSEEDQPKSVSAPPLFQCPISLELMTDPVTVCTGLTYDRSSIQQWLCPGNDICPLTGQTLHSRELIPNHTLAALIYKWRLTNPSDPAVEENKKLQHMIEQIDKGGACRIEALRHLKILARDKSIRSHLQSEGILPSLIRVIERFDPIHPAEEEVEAVQEAIAAIVLLSVDDAICPRDLLRSPAIRTVEWVLAKGDLESRINSATLVEKLAKLDDTAAMEIGSMDGITNGLLTLLEQNNTNRSGLRALVPLCRVVAYRVKLAEEAGVISRLIRFVSVSERAVIEASMAILEGLSTVVQGRSGIMADSLAVPTIVRSLLHVSRVATAHGVGILLNVCKNCNREDEIRDLVKTGVLQKLVALLHMDCEPRTKRRVNYLIKFLSPLQDYDSCAQFVIHL